MLSDNYFNSTALLHHKVVYSIISTKLLFESLRMLNNVRRSSDDVDMDADRFYFYMMCISNFHQKRKKYYL